MSYLMYSKMFGLQEVEELPKFILKGTYVYFHDSWTWYIHTGALPNEHNKYHWLAVSSKQMPKKAHLEALLLGIQLGNLKYSFKKL